MNRVRGAGAGAVRGASVRLHGEYAAVPAASMISGFGGGAIFPLFAAMTADYVGENYNATNYGLVYSSNAISGRVGAGLGSVVVATWGYGAAFVLAGSIGLGSGGVCRCDWFSPQAACGGGWRGSG